MIAPSSCIGLGPNFSTSSGLGWVSQLMGWVGSGHTNWTHRQLCGHQYCTQQRRTGRTTHDDTRQHAHQLHQSAAVPRTIIVKRTTPPQSAAAGDTRSASVAPPGFCNRGEVRYGHRRKLVKISGGGSRREGHRNGSVFRGTMASAEHEPITGVWGQSPWSGDQGGEAP